MADGLRLAESLTLHYSDAVLEALDDLPDSFLLTESSIPGHSVVFASRAFLSMSGYSRADVLGRDARMLHGPVTDRRSVMEIREASDGCVVHFLAVLVPIRRRSGSSGPAPMLLLGSCRDEVDGSMMGFDSFDDADSREAVFELALKSLLASESWCVTTSTTI